LPHDTDPAEGRSASVNYRLMKLYRAAAEDGHCPDPEDVSHQWGRGVGADDASRAIRELTRPTHLATHSNPQYTFGYFEGVATTLREWADRLEADGNMHAAAERSRLDEQFVPGWTHARLVGGAFTAQLVKTPHEGRESRSPRADFELSPDFSAANLTIAPAMPATPDLTDSAELRELDALERMVDVLCEHVGQLVREAERRGELTSREADFQVQVFAERREQAAKLIDAQSNEPCETRICRWDKLADGLECSRAYFRELASAGSTEMAQAGN